MRNRHMAHQLLVQYNMRLLAKVARSFEGRGIELEDMIVEGTQGLEKAIDRYDPSKGYKFSTYAYMWIRQAISRSIMEYSRVVRLPGHVYEVSSKPVLSHMSSTALQSHSGLSRLAHDYCLTIVIWQRVLSASTVFSCRGCSESLVAFSTSYD